MHLKLSLGIFAILTFSSISFAPLAHAEHLRDGFVARSHPWAPARSESSFGGSEKSFNGEHDCDAADRACMNQCGGPRMENYACWHRCMISFDCDS